MASTGQLPQPPDAPRPSSATQTGSDGTIVQLGAARQHRNEAAGETLEQRMQVLEKQASELAGAVVATREIMALVERRLDELSDVQARVRSLRADLDASSRRVARRSRTKDPCPLSSRELEVLIALSEGKVYKQIARELSLSVSTVRSHLHHAYTKLDVADRTQAVLLATNRGWI